MTLGQTQEQGDGEKGLQGGTLGQTQEQGDGEAGLSGKDKHNKGPGADAGNESNDSTASSSFASSQNSSIINAMDDSDGEDANDNNNDNNSKSKSNSSNQEKDRGSSSSDGMSNMGKLFAGKGPSLGAIGGGANGPPTGSGGLGKLGSLGGSGKLGGLAPLGGSGKLGGLGSLAPLKSIGSSLGSSGPALGAIKTGQNNNNTLSGPSISDLKDLKGKGPPVGITSRSASKSSLGITTEEEVDYGAMMRMGSMSRLVIQVIQHRKQKSCEKNIAKVFLVYYVV